MPRAIVLFSGGLDSCLCAIALQRLGISVTAVHFVTPFGCNPIKSSAALTGVAERFGFELLKRDIHEDFMGILKNPAYGYGKNMNPCIDCKILMLRKAAQIMAELGADFVATGEVVGQRPMSQQRHIFNLMEKNTGLKGLILRPLSARLLPATIAEEKGLIDRARLYNMSGRSRKAQMALAEEFGLTEYPAPAGGCLLTDPNFSLRLRDLLAFNSNPEHREIELLRVGRHFRLSDRCKAVVGRNKQDNDIIDGLSLADDTLFRAEDVYGPLVLITNKPVTEEHLIDGARLCAQYSDGKALEELSIRVQQGGSIRIIRVNPSEGRQLRGCLIRQ